MITQTTKIEFCKSLMKYPVVGKCTKGTLFDFKKKKTMNSYIHDMKFMLLSCFSIGKKLLSYVQNSQYKNKFAK